MSGALPGFTFDQKTGELSRGGKVLALKPAHSIIMTILSDVPCGEFVATKLLLDRLDVAQHELAADIGNLRQRMVRIGMSIQGKRKAGYRIIVQPMPRWEPSIPPVIDDPALLKMPS